MVDRESVIGTTEFKSVIRPDIGKMYFYNYDPKTKDKLPYYDRYPLIFCVRPLDDGFHGLNLHYLSYRYRLIFYNNLLEKTAKNKPEEKNIPNLVKKVFKSAKKLLLKLRKSNQDLEEAQTEEERQNQLYISYRILKSYSGFSYYKPCFKRYLYSKVKSPIIEIPSEKWEEYLIAPLEAFEKESKENVWKESLKKI